MELIRERREGAVGVIELVNPPYNFMTADMVEELEGLISLWGRDPELRAIVITGGIEGFFISHYSIEELNERFGRFTDLPEFVKRAVVLSARSTFRFYRFLEWIPVLRRIHDAVFGRTDLMGGLVELQRIHRVFGRLEQMDRAVIAAINGDAMGGGCELAMACDYRLMARGDARIGLIETLVGIVPGAGGTQRLPRLVGRARALEIIFDGKVLDADRAAHVGLVNEAVEPADLMPRAMELARRLARRPRASVLGAKRTVGAAGPAAAGYAMEKEHFVATGISGDASRANAYYLRRLGEGATPKQIYDELREGAADLDE